MAVTVADLEARATKVTRWIALCGLAGLVALALVTVTDALLRSVFSSPIDGVDEVSRLVVAIVIASFFPLALSEHHHINITFLGKVLGRRAHAWLDTLGAFVTLLFFVVLGWQFIRYTIDLKASGETTWLLAWPAAPWWRVATLFMLLCVPVQVVELLSRARLAVRGGQGLPPDTQT